LPDTPAKPPERKPCLDSRMMKPLDAANDPVGVIGLGLLGTALAERLVAAGYDVRVHNRSREKAEPLIAAGARWSDNPLADCPRVVISLYTTDVVEEVLAALDATSHPGVLLLDTTTGDPVRTPALGQWLADAGVDYLEVPISGSSEQTRRGEATALVAGPVEAAARCRDLLRALVLRHFAVGGWGNGVRMKLVTNLVLGLNRAALAEGLAFASSIGLTMDAALEVLMNCPAYSRTMDAKGPKMVAGDFAPQAKLSQHLKDVRIILDQGRRTGQELPMSHLHCELLERAEQQGWGELDNSVIIRAIDSNTSGIEAKS
jgi:3-hydroxyisobutyrate dehydrogenase-like beta-hydroxyacid dehydrogenase